MRESTHIIVSRRGLFLTFFYQSRPCKARSGARIGICTAFTFLITRLTILHGTIKDLNIASLALVQLSLRLQIGQDSDTCTIQLH